MTPLLVASTYSFHYGTASPRALAGRARELGYGSLALTDRDGVYGVPAFIEACEAEGLAPVIGVELSLDAPHRPRPGAPPSGRALILALDRGGFSRICRLLSRRLDPGFDPRGELLLDARGLAVATDDAALLFSEGAEDFYALLTPSNRPLWRGLLRSGRRPLASGEVRFLEPGDRALQRLLVAIGGRKTVADVVDAELSPGGSVMVRPSALEDLYSDVPEAAAYNSALAAQVSFRSLFDGFVFPRYRGFEGGGAASAAGQVAASGYASAGQAPAEVSAETTVEVSAETTVEVSAETTLRALVYEGAGRRYGLPLGEAARRRVEHELGVIAEKGFSDYFLVVRDIVRRASRTCGRGSAAASVVSYALGITDVDPIEHGLYFERFLNPGRIDPPDIDVDFAWDERDALLEEVMTTYGEARAARVSNHVCFQPRSALREAARAYGMPDGEISARERLRYSSPPPGVAIADAIADAGSAARDVSAARVGDGAAIGATVPGDEEWDEIERLAARLPGIPRHLGVHSGGVILVPDELAGRVPIERSGSGIRVTAWDKEGVEAAGLVKIDLLGNRSLAVVRDALANLAENGRGLDEAAWRPLDDPETVGLLARGDTMGVFYVESPAMRLLQKKTGRGDFEHLVIHSSIIRPAANRYIGEYIDRLNGKPYRPLHPLIGDILAESYGIMCYQEDVCKVAVALAGFSPAEADRVRKVLSKKDASERLASYRDAFAAGAAARGVDEPTIAEVWAMIESFSGYSFVKAHSASYAMLSFRSAYLRRHHPAEFMAAVISNRGGYYSTLAYVSEARRMGLSVLPPDVEASELRCRGSGSELRFGLGMIGSLGDACARAIVEERRSGGPYRTVDELARRTRPDRTDAEALAGSGALDSLSPGLPRARKLMRLLSDCEAREPRSDAGAGLGRISSGRVASEQGDLFAAETEPRASSIASPQGGSPQGGSPQESGRRRLEAEMRYLGTTLAAHPLALWPAALSCRRSIGRDLPRLVGRRVRLVGWPVTAKSVITSGGQAMEFVSFEDETALYEAVLFPEAYARFRHLLFEERPLLIVGLVEEDRGAVTLTVDSMEKAG